MKLRRGNRLILLCLLASLVPACTNDPPITVPKAAAPSSQVSMWDPGETPIFQSSNRWNLMASDDPHEACLRIVFEYVRESSGHYCSEEKRPVVMAMETWEGYRLNGQFAIYGVTHPDTEELALEMTDEVLPMHTYRHNGYLYFADIVITGLRPKGALVMRDGAGEVLESLPLCGKRWWRNQGSSCDQRRA